mmetsp:Transcript_55246/g.167948  ORF Transcript_55246/g.167948 Transcript_55246/m.167948 type:complete len:271 (+) Transcript_55246:1492-2304(+)
MFPPNTPTSVKSVISNELLLIFGASWVWNGLWPVMSKYSKSIGMGMSSGSCTNLEASPASVFGATANGVTASWPSLLIHQKATWELELVIDQSDALSFRPSATVGWTMLSRPSVSENEIGLAFTGPAWRSSIGKTTMPKYCSPKYLVIIDSIPDRTSAKIAFVKNELRSTEAMTLSITLLYMQERSLKSPVSVNPGAASLVIPGTSWMECSASSWNTMRTRMAKPLLGTEPLKPKVRSSWSPQVTWTPSAATATSPKATSNTASTSSVQK